MSCQVLTIFAEFGCCDTVVSVAAPKLMQANLFIWLLYFRWSREGHLHYSVPSAWGNKDSLSKSSECTGQCTIVLMQMYIIMCRQSRCLMLDAIMMILMRKVKRQHDRTAALHYVGTCMCRQGKHCLTVLLAGLQSKQGRSSMGRNQAFLQPRCHHPVTLCSINTGLRA